VQLFIFLQLKFVHFEGKFAKTQAPKNQSVSRVELCGKMAFKILSLVLWFMSRFESQLVEVLLGAFEERFQEQSRFLQEVEGRWVLVVHCEEVS